MPVVSKNLPDHNYIEQNSSVNSKRAEELKRENAMLTEKIQTLFEENKTLKQKLWDLSDSGDAILVQEHIHDAVNAYLILKTVQPLTPSLSHGIIPRMEKSFGYIDLFR